MAQVSTKTPRHSKKVVGFYQLIVSIVGLAVWGMLLATNPIPTRSAWGVIAAISIFMAFTYTFPIQVHNTSIVLTQIIFLGAGLLYGPVAGLWSALIGIIAGAFTRLLFKTFPRKTSQSFFNVLFQGVLDLSILVFPFVLSNMVVNWQDASIETVPMLNIMGTYIAAHTVFISLDLWVNASKSRLSIRQLLVTLVIIELIPLPFLLISLNASVILGNTTLIFIAGLPAIMSIFLFDAEQSRAGLERRVQDLSLLNQISEVINKGSDLDSLLEAIQYEITELLGVNNFYIALQDPKTDMIWYPIAIKGGEPQEWPHRSPSNRLTDRVIQERIPLLLVDRIDRQLSEIGADPDSGELRAWLGVPLHTPEDLDGCMAVFSISERTFSEDDLKLLTTLSGQVGIALQAALRQEKAGRRLSRQAEQLKILEQISRQLSGTLQAEHLFTLILQSALEYTNSAAGSITILNTLTNRFEVKAQEGYPEDHEPDTTPLSKSGSQTLHPQIIESKSGGSQLSVPIYHAGEVIGLILIESPKPDEYSQNELNFVSQLAQQASQAIRNSALYEETQRRLREQATLSTVISHVASKKELNYVLDRVVQAFSAMLSSANSGIYLWNPEEDQYELKSIMVRDPELEVTLPRQITMKEWHRMQRSQSATGPLRVTADTGSPAQLIKLEQAQQVLIFPLDVGSQPVGLVTNYLATTEPIPKAELQLPRTVAAHSAIAIQNATLFSHVSAGRDRLQAVLNAVGDGVLMVDEGGRITLANKPVRTLTGTSDLSGRRLSTLPSRVLSAIGLSREEAERFSQPQENGERNADNFPSYHFQAQDRFYERYIAQVMSEFDLSLGWVIVVRDVTEDFQINQTRELLTETLVHDLRSPVGAIKTTLEILEEALLSDDPDPVITQSLDIANRSTNRVLGLIESLLDISHLESGQIELATQPMDLRDLIVETVEEMIPQANEDHVILSHKLPESLPQVLADQPMIRRVLINLIDNSLKFTPEGGLVTVSTEENGGGKLNVCISDTGPGIPDEYRQEVFSRFSQVPGTRGRRRGSGLGLTFCRLAIEAHHEKIWIRDGQNERGTTLVFSLPVFPQPAG
jgi:NtrC-family two-component system sensor histidine kinase KinB